MIGGFGAAPSHTPRGPLMDVLYWILSDYGAAKRIGLKSVATHRRRALVLIRRIKEDKNA